MKRKLLLILLLTIMSLLFSACNESEQNDQTSSTNPKITENNQQTKEENNSEIMLEVLKMASEKCSFEQGGNYGRFMAKLGENYDDSVINPYTNETDIHILNRTEGILDQQDNNYSGYSASVVIIDDSFSFLKNVEKTEVTYGCNPNNKGVVMGFVYQDGFYIYEVDENGEKQNEITYIFPGYEYPSYAYWFSMTIASATKFSEASLSFLNRGF